MFNKLLSRRAVLETGARTGVGAAAAASPLMANVAKAAARPNILFIAIDDLNDWIEPLGGYDGVLTPNLKRLATITRSYANAHTSAPACSAARSSVMFGVQPFHSGVYTNYEDWQIGSKLVGQTSLVLFFKDQGYRTIGTGKVFHDGWRYANRAPLANDPGAWDEFEFCHGDGCVVPTPTEEEEHDDEVTEYTSELSFGPTALKTTEMADFNRLEWFNRTVLDVSHDKPFFAAIGLEKPHGPFTVPRRFFDLYDANSLSYPPGVLDPRHNTLDTNADVADLPNAARAMLKQFGVKDHARIVGDGKWKDIVHAYLATISFTDYCLGRVLDAWLKGPNAQNTIVVLWSDHGWQLGEKLGWRKFTLWERATRVPLMIGGSVGDREIRPSRADQPVSTLSLFPTLADLAFGAIPRASDLGGLPLDGASLKANLLDTAQPSGPALTTWMLRTEGEDQPEAEQRHFSIRTRRYRYIQYGDGGRELYDHQSDRYEFDNLLYAPTAETEDIARQLKKFAPPASDCVARAGKAKKKAA